MGLTGGGRCWRGASLSSSAGKTGSMDQKEEIKEEDVEQKQSLSARLTGSLDAPGGEA